MNQVATVNFSSDSVVCSSLFQTLQSLLEQVKDDTWNTESEHFSPTSVLIKILDV